MIDSFASNEQNSFMIKQAVNFLKNNPVEESEGKERY